ncbi:MAG: hypothetical protein U0X74_16210 [Anaerolineales bacterium]
MNKSGRSQLALGIILILIGGWFLLNQTMPEFKSFFEPYTEWPVNMLLIGGGILIIGLATGSPGLAVPAAIVAGIGGIFYYQKTTGNYDSWSYMWALIPGFVGIGVVLQGLLGEDTGHNLKRGLNLMVVSAVLFLGFAAFLGGWNILGEFGPAALLILLGVWVLGSGLYRSYRKKE